MRLRLGRPSLTPYADRFDVPAAGPGGLSVTFLGVSTLLLDDGTSALMTDGFFSRPGLGRVALGTIAPEIERIDACLPRAGIDRLEAVLPVHSHFDHVMDSAVVAARTGATLVGGASTANVGRGLGLDRHRRGHPRRPDDVRRVDGDPGRVRHCPPARYPGTIDEPVVPPVRAKAYRAARPGRS